MDSRDNNNSTSECTVSKSMLIKNLSRLNHQIQEMNQLNRESSFVFRILPKSSLSPSSSIKEFHGGDDSQFAPVELKHMLFSKVPSPTYRSSNHQVLLSSTGSNDHQKTSSPTIKDLPLCTVFNLQTLGEAEQSSSKFPANSGMSSQKISFIVGAPPLLVEMQDPSPDPSVYNRECKPKPTGKPKMPLVLSLSGVEVMRGSSSATNLHTGNNYKTSFQYGDMSPCGGQSPKSDAIHSYFQGSSQDHPSMFHQDETSKGSFPRKCETLASFQIDEDEAEGKMTARIGTVTTQLPSDGLQPSLQSSLKSKKKQTQNQKGNLRLMLLKKEKKEIIESVKRKRHMSPLVTVKQQFGSWAMRKLQEKKTEESAPRSSNIQSASKTVEVKLALPNPDCKFLSNP